MRSTSLQKRTHRTYSQSQVLCIYSIFITFIHVYDSCLDLWLMICESLWNTALSPSPSCRVAVLVSHISKLKALMGFRSSGEFLGFFSFLALGDGGWSSGFNCVLSHCSSLTDIWKSPIRKIQWATGAECRVSCLETAAGCSIGEPHTPATASAHCVQLSRGECMSIYSWMYTPCLGNVDDRYGTKTRQYPEIISEVHQCSSNERGKRSRLLLFFAFFFFFFPLKLAFVLKQQNWQE